MIRTPALIALPALLLSACTWVAPDDQGRQVRVAYSGDLSACERLGEIQVSVRHAVGGFERNEMKVRDELESLARNEGAVMGADTIQAMTDAAEGGQRFSAWRCSR